MPGQVEIPTAAGVVDNDAACSILPLRRGGRAADGYRSIADRIQILTAAHARLAERYKNAKAVVRAFRRPSFYEVSQRCNLWCEGCYYFEDDRRRDLAANPNVGDWEGFFRAEHARQVSIAYFVGAEPALEQQRLRAAAAFFPHGKVGTNGTIKIDPEIPFRLGISIWGDEQTDARLRGGAVIRKVVKNYEGDPRAIMLFTSSPWNLGSIKQTVQMCSDHGLKITFNMFSPTRTYLDKIHGGAPNDDRFFRIGRRDNKPCFSDGDLRRVEELLDEVLTEYPDVVVYSKAYNRWVTRPGPLYDMESDTGFASNCGSRIRSPLSFYTANLEAADIKCCTPDVDCTQCRLYSGGWSSKFTPTFQDVASEQAFSDWLEMIETVGKIFLYPNPAYSHQSDRRDPAPAGPRPLQA